LLLIANARFASAAFAMRGAVFSWMMWSNDRFAPFVPPTTLPTPDWLTMPSGWPLEPEPESAARSTASAQTASRSSRASISIAGVDCNIIRRLMVDQVVTVFGVSDTLLKVASVSLPAVDSPTHDVDEASPGAGCRRCPAGR
jgi:hypothetical protein